MKSLTLLLIFSGTLHAMPPGAWGPPQPAPIKRTHRFGKDPIQEKDPNEEAETVQSVSVQEIKNRVRAGCIEYTGDMLNGNLSKQERDVARWRLTNLQAHPYYDPRGAGFFPHSGNDTC